MSRNGQLSSWPGLLHALEARFALSQYDDPFDTLFKLTQRGTVSEYLAEFESLANHIIGLPPTFLINCFVSGLTSKICREVQASQPLTMVQVATLARLHEEKLEDSRHLFRRRPPGPTLSPGPLSSRTTPLLPAPALLPTPPKSPAIPFKRLSPEELASRREKGLCFNCDEKFSQGHMCAPKLFLLIADKEDNLSSDFSFDLSDDNDEANGPSPAQISLHALSGHMAPETLRLLGRINRHKVWILIDVGSTHNFIQECLVSILGLNAQFTQPLMVMVGNSHELKCSKWCRDISLQVQDQSFIINFHVLSLCGADLILNVEWLKLLGPILTDYNDLTMKFLHDGRVVELRGEQEGVVHSITAHQLQRLIRTDGASQFFHLHIEPPSTQMSYTPHQNPEI